MGADKEWTYFMRTNLTFSNYRLQRFDEVAGHRNDPLLAALAAQEHLRSLAIQLKIVGH